MSPCQDLGNVGLEGWICGPADEHFKPRNLSRLAWCFRCRRRGRHWLVLIDQPWYDVQGMWICERCGGDHTDFPA